MGIDLCAPIVIITIKHFHNKFQLSEVTTMNAIGAECAASSSLVSKAANSLPNFCSHVEQFFSNAKLGVN